MSRFVMMSAAVMNPESFVRSEVLVGISAEVMNPLSFVSCEVDVGMSSRVGKVCLFSFALRTMLLVQVI